MNISSRFRRGTFKYPRNKANNNMPPAPVTSPNSSIDSLLNSMGKLGGSNVEDDIASQMQVRRPRAWSYNVEEPPLLPPQRAEDEGRLTVVLDMDETLLHSEFNTDDNNYRQAEARQTAKSKSDFSLRLVTDDCEETVKVHLRPKVKKFLELMDQHFEPILFTAALPVYAQPVLDRLDTKRIFRTRLYRDATVTYRGEQFVKDLGLFGRDMGRIVIVDNNPYAMLPQPDNAIPIPSFFEDKKDDELEKVAKMLMKMKKMKDVRPYLRKQFRFREQVDAMMEWN